MELKTVALRDVATPPVRSDSTIEKRGVPTMQTRCHEHIERAGKMCHLLEWYKMCLDS